MTVTKVLVVVVSVIVHICKDCFVWDNKYDNILCSGLTKFHNLETLVAVDLNLSNDLWIEFAKNCTCLREIYFDSSRPGQKDSDNFCWWDEKEAALDALFQIPTLEKVYVGYRISMSYFPPGPSNIQYLYLNVELDDEEEEHKKKVYEIYSNNLHTHQNIKTLILNKGNPSAYNVADLKLDEMQLEELVLESSAFDDIGVIITTLPQTIKRLKFRVWLSDIEKLISALRPLTSLNIEEIEITVVNHEDVLAPLEALRAENELYEEFSDLRQIKDRLRDKFRGTSSLKKFVFLNYCGYLVLDVLAL